MNQVVLNKIRRVDWAINRIHKVYEDNPKNLENLTKQDSIIMNIQRACEASIDIAMHVVAEHKLGIPKASYEGFDLLQEANIIKEDLAKSLTNMVEFRNMAVRGYEVLNLDILQVILEKHLDDFENFCKTIMQVFSKH